MPPPSRHPPPRSAARPAAPTRARSGQDEAGVAYDVEPSVVLVLVGALALLIVVAVVAAVALAPSGRILAQGHLEPATSVARHAPGEGARGGGSAGAAGAAGQSPPASAGSSTQAGAVDPAGAADDGLANAAGGDVGGAGGPAAQRVGGWGARSGPFAASAGTPPNAGAASGGGAAGEAARAPSAGGGAGPVAASSGAPAGSPPVPIASPPDGAAAGATARAAAGATAAAVPVDLDAVPGQSTAVVRWDVDGSTLELGGFRVVWTGGGRTIDQQVGPETRKAQADELVPSTGYSVAVTPVSRDGRPNDGATRTISVTTLPDRLPPPTAPANLALAAGRGSLTVTWTADPGDLATTQFYVSWGCCAGFLGGLSVDRDVRTFTITGLAPGVNHTVEVQALGPNLDADLATKRTVNGTPG